MYSDNLQRRIVFLLVGLVSENPADIELRCRYKVAYDECRKLVRVYTKKTKSVTLIIWINSIVMLRTIMTCKSGLGTLRDNDHKLVVDDKQQVDLVNNFFRICRLR